MTSSMPCLSTVIPSALRRARFFLIDHHVFLIPRLTFFRGKPRAGKREAPTSQSCANSKEKQASHHPQGPRGHLRLLIRCQWHYKKPLHLPVSLPQSLVLSAAARQVHHDVTLQAWKRTETYSSPKSFGDAGALHEEEDLGPGVMPCEILPGESCGDVLHLT